MLVRLRKKKTAKRVLWFLAATIIPVFTLWGVSSAVRSSKFDFAGKIYGSKVSARDFLKAYSTVRMQAVLLYGDNFNKIVKLLNLKKQSWDRIVLLREANRRRIKVRNEEIVAYIQSLPLFQTEGVFNEQIYNRILTFGLQIKPREFEEQIRDNLKISKLRELITSDVGVKEEELKEAYWKQNTEYKIIYTKISAEDFLEQEADTEETDTEENPEPDAETLDKARELTTQKAQELLRKIEESAKSAKEEGKDFDFSKILSEMEYQPKETDYFTTNSFEKGIGVTNRFAELCFKLKVGELGYIVGTETSFTIFSLLEKKEPTDETYQEEKEEFKEDYLLTKKNLTFQGFLQRLIEVSKLEENEHFFEKFKLQ